MSECNLQSDSTAERSQTGCRHILKRKFDKILDKVTGLRIIIFTLVLQVRYVSFGCSTFIIWQLINNTCASKVKCFQLPCICSIFLHAATNYTSCNIYSLQFVTHLAKLYTTYCTFLHWVPHVVHSATWLTSCCTFNYTLTASGLLFTTFLIFRYIQM